MSEIELNNASTVQYLKISIPEPGGIVVLRGDNDLGKSEALDAVDVMLTGNGSVEPRYGSAKGSISGLGVTVTFGRKTTRAGELVPKSIDSKWGIEDLIDPKIKDPLAADAKRIKVLLQVVDAKADIALFEPLLASKEDFDEALSKASLSTDDIIVMADRIKKDFEAAARSQESAADIAQGHADGAKDSIEGIDLKGECDEKVLQADLEAAIREESRIWAADTAAIDAQNASNQARKELAKAEAAYRGPSVEDAAVAAGTRSAEYRKAKDEVDRISSELQLAEARKSAAHASVSEANLVHDHAINFINVTDKWRAQIAKDLPCRPLATDKEKASDEVSAARKRVEQGALIRKAKSDLEKSKEQAEKSAQARARAAAYRNAAAGVDGVLSSLVSTLGTPFGISAGRLVVDGEHDGKPMKKTFAELSLGTRAKIGAGVAIDHVGRGGVFRLKQEFFEGIAPARQIELANQARDGGVVMITAEATDDPEITTKILP